jgi:hypothetical protein
MSDITDDDIKAVLGPSKKYLTYLSKIMDDAGLAKKEKSFVVYIFATLVFLEHVRFSTPKSAWDTLKELAETVAEVDRTIDEQEFMEWWNKKIGEIKGKTKAKHTSVAEMKEHHIMRNLSERGTSEKA